MIPQCDYPETHSLETTGMSSFSLSLSLLGETFFSPFSFGFALFLYVFLTLFLSVLGMCKHRLSSRPLSRVHAHWEGGRRPRHCAHRHDNLSLTHRPMQTMGAMHVAK